MELNSEILTVGQLNEAISGLISASFDTLWVRGEISNFKSYPSGHWYFKLKDEQSQINGVMFKGRNYSVDFQPKDGDQVEVAAQVGFYAARGDMQLTVQQMRKAGAGALFEAFMKLKAKLEKEGLFDVSHKKDIPLHPKAIGIITSTQAAALKDVLTTLARRASHIPVIIYPSLVQGPEAAPGMIKALAQAQKSNQVDVILLVRGGGSIEDLWAFNDEQLAYAIASSTIPIISGVGHETDFTIADFVADLRAPTPTAAAEMATPDRLELLRQIQGYADFMQRMMRQKLEREAQRIDQLSMRLQHAIPNPTQMRQRQNQLQERLTRVWQEKLRYWRQQQEHYLFQIETLSPQRTLERGYSLILDETMAVRDPKDLHTEKTYTVAMAKGSAQLTLKTIELSSDE
ncbi:exodeoxyribonuclease 7 large subunit [Polynucleobacter sp. SHI8]|uniref:exodeoxyribonuclease VII large subunit n=1 Tax=unclassified Polynucleobacter TaxID=2640945 RepID=UPI00249281E6|nr:MULTISPECIES: exodeoxyribonuclease VII large subunit [unclassified Polynucleobacter]BDW10259.1 exodeoxyribonuclease 7 large subunit [Polynucleobacter sp. SHI2]BDW12705.1 exodeoxyribonuclease 7 large subunit [Polynucleobacter sp. SHI8]